MGFPMIFSRGNLVHCSRESFQKTILLEKTPADTLSERALGADVITANEKGALDAADAARLKAVQVDWFDAETYQVLR